MGKYLKSSKQPFKYVCSYCGMEFNDDNWFEFSSDNDLKEWIEYDYYQMNPEEESK